MKVSIVGSVGVPAKYGGFETLAENLAKYHSTLSLPDLLTVYCSGKQYSEKPPTFLNARLKYVPFNANGIQSIPYDFISIMSTVANRSDVILLLGVSGAIALPFVRIFSSTKIITNIDGIEWRREKWNGLAPFYLKFSEWIAVKFSHSVIADNEAIGDYLLKNYGIEARLIPYGGDQFLNIAPVPLSDNPLPVRYAYAICRIEPENNIQTILEAFANTTLPLFFVGNWDQSDYGVNLRQRFQAYDNITLLDPTFDPGKLNFLRSQALCYIHGHSAGGTNPSLVEAMHFGRTVIAFDCVFNQMTTQGKAIYFKDSSDLLHILDHIADYESHQVGQSMQEIAARCYRWEDISSRYFELFSEISNG